MRSIRALSLVFCLACALALAACARKPPSAPLDAGVAAASGVALCAHRVPAALCTRCNPELEAVFQAQNDWCGEHGVPESQCFQCNPHLDFAAAPAPQDWCAEHGLPESKCTRCNPKLVAKFIAAQDYCREHGFPASVCPSCKPELARAQGIAAPVYPRPGTVVRLASADTAKEAGLETVRVEKRQVSRTIEVVGQLAYDQNRFAELSARGDGLVLEVKVDVGDPVKAGQPLVVLASSAVGADQARLAAAKTRLTVAASALERRRQLAESGLGSKRDLDAAQTEHAAAQAEVDSARSALGAAGASSEGSGGRYPVSAPFAGTVVARNAVAGKSAMAGETLVEMADLSTMWALLEVPESEAHLVRAGQPVRLWFEARPAETLEGSIARVGASVDRASRTVRARVELPNPDQHLKAGAFLRARVRVAADHEAVVIPEAAVQRAEGHTLAFVKKGEGLFEPVPIELGLTFGKLVEVTGGLAPGAEVVTTGAFLLKTELLKESIGAGCCEEGG